MIHNKTYSNSITTCSKVIHNSGNPNRNYMNYADSTLKIYPEISGKVISIKGKVNNESCCENLYIYYGEGTSGRLYGHFSGSRNIPLIMSSNGPLTIKFTSNISVISSSFELIVDCIVNPQTIYSLIKNNNCRSILCEDNWKNLKKIILQNTGLCLKNCNSTSTKYHYKGNCYNNCPENTTNINFICYSNSIIKKCGNFSFESNHVNLWLKCQKDYYPIFNDKNNRYNFIDCYKNNSLENYYLDNNNLIFKPCYISCKTCDKDGTKEYHNCITCDKNYRFNLTFGRYFNCYLKNDDDFFVNNDKIFLNSYKKECANNSKYFIEEKNQYIDACTNDFPFEFKKCYESCSTKESKILDEKNNYCEIKCPTDSQNEVVEIKTCVKDCIFSQIINKLCELNFKSNSSNDEKEAQEKIIENIRKEITKGINTSEIDNGKDIIIQEEDVTFTITKTDNQEKEINSKTNIQVSI